MKRRLLFLLVVIGANVLLLPSCKIEHFPPGCKGDVVGISSKIFATGFNNPRGLKFGPDGNLYVAEGGTGGNHFSSGCQQAPPPAGPYMGNDSNSRISRVNWQGVRSTFVDYLPSCTAGAAAGSGVTGMADVAFIGNTLYALIAGAGCSHGVPDIPNCVIKINADKTWAVAANYSEFLMNNPVANEDLDDFTPDGNPWSMTFANGELIIAEPNHQEIDRVNPHNGKINRVIDISKTHPGNTDWIGPTSIASHNGNIYFGTLTPFPLVAGAATVYKVTPTGKLSVFATGFTMIVGILFDNHNNLYVLENTVGAPGPTPGMGDVVMVDPVGAKHPVISGLNLPTAMTFGPDGNLYISNTGIGAPGSGQILQVSFTCQAVGPDKDANSQ